MGSFVIEVCHGRPVVLMLLVLTGWVDANEEYSRSEIQSKNIYPLASDVGNE